ncbi:hypothetical protein PROFUN_10590 [Planoprotostelium fungivorum]|uniref:DUF676 domain-containing protein n=1 Tax=Planoprotostelium fungivorum TaxID=1890364 RepID=A0A2P6ND17_9EUKA|nr:hypothetical protein PROFUN_10590 [Planoprotostelium fungivorum]
MLLEIGEPAPPHQLSAHQQLRSTISEADRLIRAEGMADDSIRWMNVVVLSHGIDAPLGNTDRDMHYIADRLRDIPDFDLIIDAEDNHGRTREGIDVCGKRLAAEVIEVLEYQKKHVHFRLSLIGHSLGGLIIRSCLKHLYEKESTWSRIVPVSYMSLTTPHLGVRRPTGLFNYFIDFVARLWYNGRTKLVLEDQDETGIPLLFRMSDPDGPYMKALASFSHRYLFAITQNDIVVPYCSASMSSHNPYAVQSKPLSHRIIGHSGFPKHLSGGEHLSSVDEAGHCPLSALSALPGFERAEDIDRSFRQHDPHYELEYSPRMVLELNSLHWRRVDLEFNGHFSHDFVIRKATIPFVVDANEAGEFAAQKFLGLLQHDHEEARAEKRE